MTKLDQRRLPYWLSGVLFGLGMGVFSYIDLGTLWVAITIGVLTGPAFGFMFGFVMGRVLTRLRQDVTQQLGPLGEPIDKHARKKALSGPVTADARERRDALALVDFQLSQHQQTVRRTSLTLASMVALEVVLAMVTSPWFWLAAAFFAGFLISLPISAAKLRRRRTALSRDI